MSTASPYQRLPGIGREIASYTRLYLGGDHLLQISSAGFSERYKRFYFRDIQAFVCLRTQGWIWTLAICLIVGLLLIVFAFAVGNTIAASILGVCAGLFLAFAVASGARGPSCACYVRTAVQVERIPSLNRMRHASKVIAGLMPLINAAQTPADVEQPKPADPEPANEQ